MKKLRLIAVICTPLWLAACATPAPPARISVATPVEWQAPLPHHGTLSDLSQWWQQQGDPLLVQLIEAAQAVSPSIASAKAHIGQARATRVTAGAALGPSLDASASASRGLTQPPIPLATIVQAGLQASWEIDLFGGNRAARDAAQARLDGAQARWHDARVAVAAEVANQYFSLRSSQQLLAVAQQDAASRGETSRLTALAAGAGFAAPASAALARASAAEANARATQQRAQCDLEIKALVALTAMAEPDLRLKVAETAVNKAPEAIISIASIPARTLAQRPDVFNAERDVAAASFDAGSALAARYPRLSLSGSIGVLGFRTAAGNADMTTWSIGPLALSLPLFDGGRRAANVDAAQARYEEAAAVYRGKVRQAVREVEEALVNLQSTGARSDDAKVAAEGYLASFTATQARYRSGLASLVELEDARRTQLAAQTALLSLQHERQAAWVALYRAAGGGWDPGQRATP